METPSCHLWEWQLRKRTRMEYVWCHGSEHQSRATEPGGGPGFATITFVTTDSLALSQFPHLSNGKMIFPTSHGCCENYLANNVFNKYQLLLLPSCLNSAIPKMFNNRCILIRETCHFRVFETGSIFLIFSSIIFGEVIGQWPMSLYANE